MTDGEDRRAKADHGGDDFPVLQLLWPDRDGRYPWDPGYPPDMFPLQPLLYEVDAARARATALLESLRKGPDGVTPPG